MMNHERHLEFEIKELEQRLQPHDTGHIHTTIDVLKGRLEEIKTELDRTRVNEPDQIKT